jgi:hypothetical protein
MSRISAGWAMATPFAAFAALGALFLSLWPAAPASVDERRVSGLENQLDDIRRQQNLNSLEKNLSNLQNSLLSSSRQPQQHVAECSHFTGESPSVLECSLAGRVSLKEWTLAALAYDAAKNDIYKEAAKALIQIQDESFRYHVLVSHVLSLTSKSEQIEALTPVARSVGMSQGMLKATLAS